MKTHNALWMALIVAAVAVMACGAICGGLRPQMDAYTASARQAAVEPVTVPYDGVDVNHAGIDALDELPGIGPVLAQAIIDDRNVRGPFFYPEDLLQVSGIGPARLAAIIDMVAIGE